MQVTLLKENEDGSANYSFDLTTEERELILKLRDSENFKPKI